MNLVKTSKNLTGLVLKWEAPNLFDVMILSQDGAYIQNFQEEELIAITAEAGYGYLMSAYCMPSINNITHASVQRVFSMFFQIPNDEEANIFREIVDTSWMNTKNTSKWNFETTQKAIFEHRRFRSNGWKTQPEVQRQIDRQFGVKIGKEAGKFWRNYMGEGTAEVLPLHYLPEFAIHILLDHPDFPKYITEVLQKEKDFWPLLRVIMSSQSLLSQIQGVSIAEEF